MSFRKTTIGRRVADSRRILWTWTHTLRRHRKTVAEIFSTWRINFANWNGNCLLEVAEYETCPLRGRYTFFDMDVMNEKEKRSYLPYAKGGRPTESYRYTQAPYPGKLQGNDGGFHLRQQPSRNHSISAQSTW